MKEQSDTSDLPIRTPQQAEVVVNPQNDKILRVNSAAQDWFQKPETAIVGQTYAELCSARKNTSVGDVDTLTGLPNRSRMLENLALSLETAKRQRQNFAVLFIDLDGFKQVNDSYGHAAGDELLVKVAEVLSAQIRAGDTLARIGGDEFVILLEDIPQQENLSLGAERVAQNVIQLLSEIFQLSQAEVEIGGSVGISVYPQDGKTADVLMQHADMAMYRAKNSGRNQFAFYQPEMDKEARQRALLEKQFREILKHQGLQLEFEPVYDLQQKNVVLLDAKWQLTSEFVRDVEIEDLMKLAETSFLGIELGEWHMTAVLEVLKNLTFQSDLPVSIRLNAMHFKQKQFVDWLSDALSEQDVAPESLVLELSENCLSLQNINLTERMNALSKLGVQLHIENFGAGFASLKYLGRMDVNAIKISGFFSDRISMSQASESMIAAMMAFAYQLRMHRIASGIQNAEQLFFVKSQQCDWGQGPFLCAPILHEDLDDFISQALQGDTDLDWGLAPEDEV